jgi:hypothetical protein
VTIETTTIPAGWYKDPAGSTAQRWWNGREWTDHLQQPAPVPVVPPVVPQPVIQQPVAQQQELSLSHYSPTTGYAQAPRDTAWGNDPYANRTPLTNAHVNNSIAWISLVAGLVSIGAIFFAVMFPGNYYLPIFGLTATITGIRAISRYRRRTVTNLWAPIIGIVCGVIAEFILILGMIIGTTGVPTSAPMPVSTVGPTGSTTNYDMGQGTPQYLPSGNATLSQATMDETKIVSVLQADYANGKTGAAADGSWPSEILHNAAGEVTTSDGRDLGALISPGWHLAYKLEPNGAYLLEVSGTNTTEVAVFVSDTSEYAAWCEASDTTCKTASPITPLTSNGDGTVPPTTT